MRYSKKMQSSGGLKKNKLKRPKNIHLKHLLNIFTRK